MTALFQKMNLGTNREILVLNAPENFEVELAKLNGVSIVRSIARLKSYTFAMFFVATLKDVERCAAILKTAAGDACVWFAYPKGTSRKYKCEFNRDTGWSAVGAQGFEAVRQVAVDEDWSALRFRRVEFVKTLTRGSNNAISEAGKARVAGVEANGIPSQTSSTKKAKSAKAASRATKSR